MIEARGLTRRFGDRLAVDEVTFTLERGQLCALLGPNGAGKTTIVRMLLGLIGPSAGSATVAGVSIPGPPNELAALRRRAGLLTETPGMYDRLSAEENLAFFGTLYRVDRLPDRIEEQLRRLGLWDRRRDPVGTFSKGMKQRLAIARAIFHDPDVVFLDEPTAGLDPEAALEVRSLIATLKAAGRTILVCTHNLAEATALADVVAVLSRRLLAFGPATTLGRRADGVECRVVVAGEGSAAGSAMATLSAVRNVLVDRSAVTFNVANPDVDIPRVVTELVHRGIGVREVRLLERTLEDTYLDLVGSRHD